MKETMKLLQVCQAIPLLNGKTDQDLEHHGPRGPEVTALKVKVMSWLCTLIVGFPISRSHDALFSAAGSATVAWRDPFH